MLNTNTTAQGKDNGGRPELDSMEKSDSAEMNDDQ